jgi:hypothetical protein
MRESFSDMIRAVHEFEMKAGVFGPTRTLQESKSKDLHEQSGLPQSSDKETPDPLDRLFARMGLDRASYPKAQVKVIDEAPRNARLVTEPKPTSTPIPAGTHAKLLGEAIELPAGIHAKLLYGEGAVELPDGIHLKLCR